ncbi:MAG: transglycosylase domain-containing protein [Deltaproteobacteria bacterium]|nr:transglycosylase domain-containing protein [Deltaproteobacteria bacterium]
MPRSLLIYRRFGSTQTALYLVRTVVRGAMRLTTLLAIAALIFGVLWHGLPPRALVDTHRFAHPQDTVIVTDRHGAALKHVRADGMDRRWIDLQHVSPTLISAILAAEDTRFVSHHGVDWRAVARAVLTNPLPWHRRNGASTITQQVIKLVYGRRAGVLSKGMEILRAGALEKLMSKDEILEQYVNRLPFGDRIEGVARASEAYFGRPPSELTVAESALIAGIPQAPSVTEPRRHLARAIRRRNEVLDRMLQVGFIDRDTHAIAIHEVPSIRTDSPHPDEAPRFVEVAMEQWRGGKVVREGMSLRTSLDLELQRRCEQLVSQGVARFASRGVTNGAAVVIGNASGEILAYVSAARQGPDAPGGALDLLDRPRQPGSTLKPFVYELLFEKGGTAATILDDISLPMTGAQGRLFEAHDYDGRERGPVRARVALASSLNLAAIDAAARVGQDSIVRRLRLLGIRNLQAADHYGAAAVLGGLDVAPIDLARAYSTLARGGTSAAIHVSPHPASPGTELMKPDAVAVAVDILSDPRARADGFGADLTEASGLQRFGLKTGTSTGWRDAWAVAFTRSLTVVVWLGDPAGQPLGAVSGFEAAAPVAARILAAATARASANGATDPRDVPLRLLTAEVCASSGLRPGPGCHHVVREQFAPGSLPVQECEAHDDQGRSVLPPRYAQWVRATRPAGVSASFLVAEGGSVPEVSEPRDGTRLLIDPSRGETAVRLRAALGGSETIDVRWEVDGRKVGGDRWAAAAGAHEIVAVFKGRRSKPSRVEVDVP